MDGLEKVREIDYVVFDKTGTLTKGEFGVTDVVPTEGHKEDEVLKLAASLDQNSEHVIAKAIVEESKVRGVGIEDVSDYKSLPGKGGKGKVGEFLVYVGNNKILKEEAVDNSLNEKSERLMNESKTLVFVVSDKSLVGVIALSDVIRPESKEAIDKLHGMGHKVAMLTGDTREVAASVAAELGIDTFFAEVLPEDKVKKVRELQGSGDKVMMVGDGVNDAPALIQADVGVAIGAGTDVAMQSAEIVLVKNNPLDIVKLINLSHATMKKMHQNLWWATGYNIVAIPLASGILYNYGIILRPEWGALLMTASSIIVVLNALLLKKIKLK
jgi:Cu2+-exporting ATPase